MDYTIKYNIAFKGWNYIDVSRSKTNSHVLSNMYKGTASDHARGADAIDTKYSFLLNVDDFYGSYFKGDFVIQLFT